MTDEIFRDGFCDDIFRSMKMQMEPSDDVVGSLLAKIAAEAPSPVAESDNVIPFRKITEEVESAPRKHIANSRLRSYNINRKSHRQTVGLKSVS